jgi:hypothetical protein
MDDLNDNPLLDLTGSDTPGIGDAPVSPSVAIGALAMNFAMKYHDINTVQDGVLYQQRKMEGHNFQDLHLDMVFETAKRIEIHLMGTSERIAHIVMDVVGQGMAEEAMNDLADEIEARPESEDDAK